MPAGDSTSLAARLQYRLERQLKRLSQTLSPTATPEPALQAQSLTPLAELGDVKTFTETTYGSGAYGRWILDEYGLPAYRYEMDQFTDDRAAYPVSEGAFRRDHWHQVGNERITGLASNDGTVQVFIADRGGLFLNHFSYGDRVSWLGAAWEVFTILLLALPRALKNLFVPGREPGFIKRLRTALNAPGAHNRDDQQHAYAGGFGYMDDGLAVWSTAYSYSPALREQAERIFGMGYYKTVTQRGDLRVTRIVYAPAGNVPALLIDVELHHSGAQAATVSYYEYWDVNVQQLPFQAFRSGVFGSVGDAERRKIHREFKSCIVWDADARALRFHLQPPDGSPSLDIAHEISWQPPDIFLADLSGTPNAIYTDKAAFFGAGGAEQPDGIHNPNVPEIRLIHDTIMPYCMVLRRDVNIPAGGSVRLRFAYGTVEPTDRLNCAAPYPNGQSPVKMPDLWQMTFRALYHQDNPNYDPQAAVVDYWKARLTYFSIGSAPHLQREMAWHAYYLQSSTLYHEYFGGRVVPQGSAYLYLHGIDGVPRDFALYVLPLVYLNPGLARDMLKLIMTLTVGDSGQMTYGYTGYGALTGALVHHAPSDLDLFFLLAISEYLAVTGDSAFLNEIVPFYRGLTQPSDRSVLNHIRVAFDHLLYDVGIGESDLIRVQDGDWSDDVVLRNVFPFAPLTSPKLTIEYGESVLNTQMTLYILPRLAQVLAGLESPDAHVLSQQIKAELEPILPRLQQGVMAHWNGQFYARAVLRYWWNGKRVLRADRLDLEGQVWPLIAEFEPQPGMMEALKEAVYAHCDAPSPIGATLATGTVWPAVSQLLTWGYARRWPELAWRSFVNHTFATKAEVYPHTWMNIWTGPDGINGPGMAEPGGTYETAPVTPMTDFPAMNNNQHALALLGLLRVCGIEPAPDGLRIAPQLPNRYALDVPLLRLDVASECITGEYRAHSHAMRTLYVRLPARPATVQAMINDQPANAVPDADGFVRLMLPAFKAGEVVRFDVKALPPAAGSPTGRSPAPE